MTPEYKDEDFNHLYTAVTGKLKFFLAWRHATLAAFFVLVGGSLSLTLVAFEKARLLCFLIPAMTSPICLFFMLLDKRNRELFDACYSAGRHLETIRKTPGVFLYLVEKSQITIDSKGRQWKLTHTKLIWTLYLCTAVVMAALATLFYLDFNTGWFDFFEEPGGA